MPGSGNATKRSPHRAAWAAAWFPAGLGVLYALTRPLGMAHEAVGAIMEAVVMRGILVCMVLAAVVNHAFLQAGAALVPVHPGLVAGLLLCAGLAGLVLVARTVRKKCAARCVRVWAVLHAAGSATGWILFWILVPGAALASRSGFVAALAGTAAAYGVLRMTSRNAPRPHPAAGPLMAALLVFTGLGLTAAQDRTAGDRAGRVVFRGGAYDAARDGGGNLFVSGLDDRQLWRAAPGAAPRRIPLPGYGKPERFAPAGAGLVLTRKTWNMSRGASIVRIDGPAAPAAMRPGPQTSMVIAAAADPRRNRLFVINEFGRRMLVLDLESLRVRRQRALPGSWKSWPYGVAVSEINGDVFVSSMFLGDMLARFSGDTESVRVRRFAPGMGLAADDARGLVYLARPLRSRVDAVDMRTLRTRFTLPAGPGVRNLCAAPRTGILAAGDFLMGRVYVYDLRTRGLVGTLHPGPFPRGLQCGDDRAELLVSTARAVVAYPLAELRGTNQGLPAGP